MPADPEPIAPAPEELLPLALSRPNEALDRARALLAAGPPPLVASIARQAVGIVLREFGDIDAAVRELQAARRLARRSGSAEREADVRATLGVALAFAGRTTAGRNALDAAVRQSSGQLNSRILLRRGGVLATLGLHRDALADLNSAVAALRDDLVWQARARTERAACYLALGSVGRAATDLARAEELFNATGQELESADAIVHRGVLALRIGDLPAALACFDQAAERFGKLGTPDPNLSIERCAALLAAGLPQDALDEADLAIARLDRIHGQATKRAELLLTAATCALAAGRHSAALDHATRAAALFDRQHRRWWRAHARLVKIHAQLAALPTPSPPVTPTPGTAKVAPAVGSDPFPAAPRRAAEAARMASFAPSGEEGLGGAQAGHGPGPADPVSGEIVVGASGDAPEGFAGSARERGKALLREAEGCARELAGLSSPELPLARLIAGRLALALGEGGRAAGHLAAAAAGRRRGPALSRAVAWLAEALRAEASGDSARLMRACRRGLEVLDQHRATLGSTELRAQASAHGAELAALGQRHALRLDRPRLLLAWSERWRATALAVPAVHPPDDERLRAELAAIRSLTSRLARARAEGLPTTHLSAERTRLERAARARALHAHTANPPTTPSPDAGSAPSRDAGAGSGRDVGGGVRRGGVDGGGWDAGALLGALGGTRLLELVDVDGRLHVLVCGAGTVRRFPAGRTQEAARQVDVTRFGLSRLAHGRSTLSPADLLAQVERAGQALERVLLGEAAAHLGDGDVVVVPPGRLHAVPWALLPSLRGRALSVAPSARSWLRAQRLHRARPAHGAQRSPGAGAHGRVVLAHGPGLLAGAAEVREVTAAYPEPVVLGGGTATVARMLDAMDGAGLAHVAAHGTFRADSPLFSSLRMDDGPLTVYDLERLHRAPGRVVLSSCDSGLTAPTGADELLGLAASLIGLGTTGVVASVVLVNDLAAVPLMVALHHRLSVGTGLAAALRDARLATSGDPLARATGYSFVCLGAG